MENKIKEKLYEALCKKYEGEISESEASLLIYFNNSVGIGEHPQHLEEMDKYLSKLNDASDKLDKLQKFHKYNLS